MTRHGYFCWGMSELLPWVVLQAVMLMPTHSFTGELPPGFVVGVSHQNQDLLAVGDDMVGSPVWRDIPGVRVYGAWQAGEIRTAARGDDRLLIVGHCLASPEDVHKQFAAALDASTPDALTDLPGSYLCLVIRRAEVLLYTDIAGQFTACYSRLGQWTLIAQHATVIARLHRRTADPVSLAAPIACSDVLPLTWGRSPVRNVHVIEAGYVLRADWRRVTVERYREPLVAGGGTTSDQPDALRSAIVAGVAARYRNPPVTFDFSGGLDSTSLAFLGTRHAGEVLAVHYHHPLSPAGDLDDAERTARLDPRITLAKVVGSRSSLPYSGVIDSGPAWGDAYPGMLAKRRALLRLRWALSNEARVHVTGEGGDALLHPSPAYLADLARMCSARRFARDSIAIARLRHRSPLRVAGEAAQLARVSPRKALRDLAGQLREPAAGLPSPLSWWRLSGDVLGWLKPEIRRELSDIAGDPRTADLLPDAVGPADHSALVELRSAGQAQRFLRELGASIGLAVHAPYLDNAVVHAAMAIPAVRKADPHRFKPLLSAALDGLVPADVLARRTKGAYQAEEYLGARQSRAQIYSWLADSRLAGLGVIETKPVLESVDRLRDGGPVPLGALNRLFAAELWLRDHEGVLL
jgi:asparagine synthase (glutamine-hydrolysing)